MNYREPPRSTTRRIPRIFVVGPLVVTVTIAAAIGYQSLEASSSPSSPPTTTTVDYQLLAPASSTSEIPIVTEPVAHRPHGSLHSDQTGAVGVADGVVPAGVTIFDDQYPAVANLDPAFLSAVRQAATDAAGDGLEIYINSGWRSAKYQEQLLQQAISQYGSEQEAAQWVASPNTSAHVTGNAVDIGPSDATVWLTEHGARYGLCQIYSNEPWHYELRPEAVDRGCPPMYADPTQDPRMHQ
ncbi:MAG: M15 family metallopeptidase [Nitrolancea sp.]